MTVDLEGLAAHLRSETEVLRAALCAAPDDAWTAVTPAVPWTVTDQVSHLAFFDDAAVASVRDPEAFAMMRDEAIAMGPAMCDVIAERHRAMAPAALLGWWAEARDAMVAAMLAAGPAARVPWYGPTFSVASAMTGRIMETWAHGQDVFDALGVAHPTTDALYDVARLCARTRANSFISHGLAVPTDEVDIVLRAPTGEEWRFGDGASEEVRGDAVEFCLVATQRRHVDDTALVATGPGASAWLRCAQAFAGPPGPGRERQAA